MSDISSPGSNYSGKLSQEQDEKILALLDNIFTMDNPVMLADTFNQLLSVEIWKYLQERLKEAQSSNDDLPLTLLEVALSLLQNAQTLGIDAAVAHYLDERQRVIDALDSLEATADPEEFYRVLEERQQILLSDLALAFLTGMYYDALDVEDNPVEAGVLKQQIDLIKEARISGVAVAWEHALAEDQQIMDVLDLLAEQNTHEAFYRVLQEKHNLLVTEKAIWFLQSQIAQLRQQGEPMADHYEGHAFLLKDAYTRNLSDAWEDFAGVDLVIQALQSTDEPEEILKLLQDHEKVLRSEAALFVLRSYIARAKASDQQDSVRYFERWYHLLEDARDSGITAAWSKFYNNLIIEIYGQLASSAPQSISDYTTALSHLEPETPDWADVLVKRGYASFTRVVSAQADKANLELAIADFQAALPVYRKYGKLDQYAETLENLGTALLLSLLLPQGQEVDVARAATDLMIVLVGTREDSYAPFHDPLQYRQQAIDNFTMAIALYQQRGRKADWARTLLKRAALYRTGNNGNVKEMFLAINDYSAALSILKKETSPFEWMGAIANRGACYLQIQGDGYEERLKQAIADLEAALSIATRQASPALYRKIQLFLYQAFEQSGRWEEAYQAIKEAIAVQHDLLAMNPAESSRLSLISDVANTQVEIYVRAAQVLSHFKRPPLQEAACLLEKGRTQLLRMTLSLDTLDPERISNPVARRRAEKFLATLNTWRQQQQKMMGLLSSAGTIPSPGPETAQNLTQQAQEDHAAFLKAIEAIRKYDDPDFMSPTPTFEDILQAVPAPESALVYLAAGAESGLALLIIRDRRGLAQTQYLPLPRLRTRVLFDLIETDTTKHIPIKLERVLLQLGGLGLDDVAKALSWSGVQKVRIIPFGLLGLFPFPAVLVQAIHGDKRCLGDLFEVTLAPSARALEAAEKRAANLDRTTHPCILVAGGVKELPFTRTEVNTVQQIALQFGHGEKNVHYLRSQAISKEKIVDVLKRSWYAHLAVHGIYQPDNPQHSHLLLKDEKAARQEHRIFLAEALERKTTDGRAALDLEGVRLLVLSACETAVIDVRQAPDEVMGLASGFLQAGAAGVIASLWAVDDRATYLLMSRFARLYLDPRRGWSPARALAEAQRWLREEVTNKLLMTYDPVGPDQASMQMQESIGEFAASRLRSLRYSYESGLAEIHAEATARALEKPDARQYADALAYADPFYWAAFAVTGC
jgi:CHAT domain-containing protein